MFETRPGTKGAQTPENAANSAMEGHGVPTPADAAIAGAEIATDLWTPMATEFATTPFRRGHGTVPDAGQGYLEDA